MHIETELAGNGDTFDIPKTRIHPPKIKFHKMRKKITNFTPKKKKRK